MPRSLTCDRNGGLRAYSCTGPFRRTRRSDSRRRSEQRFIDESRVYVTWAGLSADLAPLGWEALFDLMRDKYPDAEKGRIRNWSGQIWAFVKQMKKGDWVVMPRKGKGVLAIAEVTGEYQHVPNGADPYFHYRSVRWLKTHSEVG